MRPIAKEIRHPQQVRAQSSFQKIREDLRAGDCYVEL
jgi:hypothetical protein